MLKFIFLLFLSINFQLFAQSNATVFFPVKCVVKLDGKKVKESTIKIFEKGKLYKTIDVTKGSASFDLPTNNEYLIEVHKEGFFVKSIAINTKLEKGVEEIPLYDLTMNITSKENPGILPEDYDLLEMPVAYIAYNPKDGFYNLNKKHTKALNKSIEKSKQKFLKAH